MLPRRIVGRAEESPGKYGTQINDQFHASAFYFLLPTFYYLPDQKLTRSLTLLQATAINMIDMVGIGPFVVISTIVSLLNGPAALLAWLLGALLAFADGTVWAELGARWPEAGGSFVFLQKLFPGRGGRRMAFLFTWQTSIQAPLVVASAAIGFATYLQYLVDLRGIGSALFGHFSLFSGAFLFTDADVGPKLVSGCVVLLMVFLLYRNIQSIGRLSVVLWLITGGTLLWIIVTGLPHFSSSVLQTPGGSLLGWKLVTMAALGQASQKAVYSYLGYYNVCHLGGEIKNPERVIPRAIFISVGGIALLYLGMQVSVLSVLPVGKIAHSPFVISDFFSAAYSPAVAKVATGLILCIALASLFSVLLGYSRVPYAAAREGLFFAPFARVHPRHNIPHISLLFLGALGFLFALLFKMKEVISAIIAMRILVQFVAQAVGIIAWRLRAPQDARPYRMPFFPLPAVLSILIWLFIFCYSGWPFIAGALGIIVSGALLFELLPSPPAFGKEQSGAA